MSGQSETVQLTKTEAVLALVMGQVAATVQLHGQVPRESLGVAAAQARRRFPCCRAAGAASPVRLMVQARCFRGSDGQVATSREAGVG